MKNWKELISLPIVSELNWARYVRLIDNAAARGSKKGQGVYLEGHHCWPKSHGGVDEDWNIVNLTAREHFLAHWMLWKALRTKEMALAFHNMVWLDKGGFRDIKTNGRAFQSVREALSLTFSGANHPMYGISRFGETNPFYGRRHSERAKKSISENKKILLSDPTKNPFYGKTHSEDVRKQIFGENHPMKGRIGKLNPMFGKPSGVPWVLAIRKSSNKLLTESIWKRADIFYNMYSNGYTKCKMAREEGKVGYDNLFQGLENRFKKGWIPIEDEEWLKWKSQL